MFKYNVNLYKFLSNYIPYITGFGSTRRWENVTINNFRVMYKETTTHSIPVEITNDYLQLKTRCLPISMNTGIMNIQQMKPNIALNDKEHELYRQLCDEAIFGKCWKQKYQLLTFTLNCVSYYKSLMPRQLQLSSCQIPLTLV